MAVRVGVTGVTTKSVEVVGNHTHVKKVVIGTPVRRISSDATIRINSAIDVALDTLTTGSVLVYDLDREKWVATLDLEDQNINGGSY
jgi:hypothetical protein